MNFSLHLQPILLCLLGLLLEETRGFSPLWTIHHQKSIGRRFVLPDHYSKPPGRVDDIDTWIRWSSDSLKKAHGLSLLELMDVENIQDVHTHKRYAVLSHGTQEDPVFCYSNVAAREAFQYTEDELYQLPSRYSAPGGGERNSRQSIMDDVSNNNIWIIPSGIRQRKDKSLFEFRDVILWNVYNDRGIRLGQTAVYDQAKVTDVQPADSLN